MNPAVLRYNQKETRAQERRKTMFDDFDLYETCEEFYNDNDFNTEDYELF